jgi:NTP pyrophosphatase (non-canonical NTP hydrolase)
MGQITDLQERAWRNKVDKNFNTTNIDMEFNYTYAELAEAYDAHRKATDHVGEELADTVIFIFGLAEMLGVKLEQEILAKMDTNETRRYKALNGHYVKKETK